MMINVYGLIIDYFTKRHIVFPIKVVKDEKNNNCDLILITDNEKSHYTYIMDFSRLEQSQLDLHTENRLFVYLFTNFNNVPKKLRLHGQALYTSV